MSQVQANDLASSHEALQADAGPSIAEPASAGQGWCLWAAPVLSAALATLCFPPVDAGWLAWIAYAPVIWAVWHSARPRSAFRVGYVFGVVHFAALTPWIGRTVVAWSGTNAGWAAWVLLALIQGLWYGLFGWLAWWLSRRVSGDARLAVTACCWTAVEWLRTLGGLAMPWGLAGYTQYRALSLVQISEIVGVHGITFLVAVVSAGLAALPSRAIPGVAMRGRRSGLRIGPYVADVGVLVLPCLLYAGALTYGMLTVGLPWNGQPVVVSLIQPNLPTIGAPVDRDVAMGRLAQAAHAAEASVPSLCVWPESAVRGDAVNDQNLSSVFSSFAGLTKGYHLVGTSFAESNGAERNSAALYGPDEGLAGRYDKQRLVPFGEWFPARFALAPVAGLFRIPEADVVAGGEQAPLAAREMRLGVLICYESIFPGLARDRVRRGANVLVSVTNDSWAGRSASPRQHFAMSVFRAVETRRYLCAAGLTGVTGLIAPNGAANCAAENEPALVTDLIYLREGLTPYARWGDWFAVLCALVITLVVWRGGRRPDIQAERAP